MGVAVAGMAFGLIVLVVFLFTRGTAARARAGSRVPSARARSSPPPRAGARRQAGTRGGHGQPGRGASARLRKQQVLNPTTMYTPGGLLDMPSDTPDRAGGPRSAAGRPASRASGPRSTVPGRTGAPPRAAYPPGASYPTGPAYPSGPPSGLPDRGHIPAGRLPSRDEPRRCRAGYPPGTLTLLVGSPAGESYSAGTAYPPGSGHPREPLNRRELATRRGPGAAGTEPDALRPGRPCRHRGRAIRAASQWHAASRSGAVRRIRAAARGDASRSARCPDATTGRTARARRAGNPSAAARRSHAGPASPANPARPARRRCRRPRNGAGGPARQARLGAGGPAGWRPGPRTANAAGAGPAAPPGAGHAAPPGNPGGPPVGPPGPSVDGGYAYVIRASDYPVPPDQGAAPAAAAAEPRAARWRGPRPTSTCTGTADSGLAGRRTRRERRRVLVRPSRGGRSARGPAGSPRSLRAAGVVQPRRRQIRWPTRCSPIPCCPPRRLTTPGPADTAPVGTVPGGDVPEDPGRARARKLEQIKDFYLTAEAIGEENVDKHFDQLLAHQRELISEYFRQPDAAQPDDGRTVAGAG